MALGWAFLLTAGVYAALWVLGQVLVAPFIRRAEMTEGMPSWWAVQLYTGWSLLLHWPVPGFLILYALFAGIGWWWFRKEDWPKA